MKILIAPDKFKGSLTANEAAQAIHQGLVASGLDFIPTIVPMADGGEGTFELLTQHSGGQKITTQVQDPLGRIIDASYGISHDQKIAFIEMAAASGLSLLKDHERSPDNTHTVGTGQLIRHALASGVQTIVLGIGGTATNDAGIGIAYALGARFYDASYRELKPIGSNLIHIASLDVTGMNPLLKQVKVIALCDVDNPLWGVQGAAWQFATQKGGDEDTIKLLDDGLQSFASIARNQFHCDINFPGAGAGGGVAGGIKLFFNSELKSGTTFMLDFLNVENMIMECDLVISGEGKLDSQTLSGKVIHGLAQLCLKHKKPLYAVVGKNELTDAQLEQVSVKHALTLNSLVLPGKEIMKHAHDYVKHVTQYDLVPLIKTEI
ncbi:MAG TPA: glycerate kinase [Ohtaekwangia sp.]|nr:glycerate kinase [Ohtaekwangia sp.]